MEKENVFEGDLVINSTGPCPYTKITGSLSIYADAKLDAPKLENVGGHLYIYADAKLAAAQKAWAKDYEGA